MAENDLLAQQFEENRDRLRGVAYRMLGSMGEADDAVQETWLRLSRGDASQIENLGGWLTTVIARVCLDMLRSRKSRREESLDVESPAAPRRARTSDPEREAMLADSVGLALLVVLDRLEPAERLAFVLHDMFAVPFDEIATIVGRTPAATRQLASRARRRVQGPAAIPNAHLAEHRRVVDMFLTALRAGDFEGLIAVLDPDVVVRADAEAAAGGGALEIRGAETAARESIARARGARLLRAALIDGEVGAILAPHGRLMRAFRLRIKNGKITEIFAIGERADLNDLQLAVFKD